MSIEAVEWNAAGAAGAFEIFIALAEGGFCPALDDISKSVSSAQVRKRRQLDSQNCSDRSKLLVFGVGERGARVFVQTRLIRANVNKQN